MRRDPIGDCVLGLTKDKINPTKSATKTKPNGRVDFVIKLSIVACNERSLWVGFDSVNGSLVGTMVL
jgi:hypothetical protein